MKQNKKTKLEKRNEIRKMKRNKKTKLEKWNETGKWNEMKKWNETKKWKRKNEIKRTIWKEKMNYTKKNKIKWTIRKKTEIFIALRFCCLFQFYLAGSSRFYLLFRICLVVGKLRFLLQVCLDSKKVNIFNINLKNHLNFFNYYLAYSRIES